MRAAGPTADDIPLAKLLPPEPPQRYVDRPALAERIADAWRHRVTLVSAPAGFGKTSAVVASLAASIERERGAPSHPAPERSARLAWASLDEHDGDVTRVFRLLGAALQRATGLGGELVAGLAAPQPPPVRALLTPLLNALTRAETEVLLCLDDLHVVEDAHVYRELEYLVDHAPPGMRLLLASRADPPLPLHRWRARGQLLEVRADELRLSPGETAAVLEATSLRPLDLATSEAVHRATEGWPVGVRLASLALRGAGEGDERALVTGLAEGERFALEYLAEEVLARLEPGLRAFVLDASVLDAFRPDLIDAMRGTADADAHLTDARAAGLFVEPTAAPPGADGELGWWRLHRLFRSLLVGHARALDPRREPDLQARAADWFGARGAHELALTYAMASRDGGRIVAILEAGAYALVMEGRAALVERALDRVPADALRGAMRARLAHGWALLLRGRYDDLAALLTDLATATGAFNVHDRGQLVALRAVLADTRGQADEAMSLALEALSSVPPGDVVTRAAAQMALAGALRERGDVGGAIGAYEAALPLCRAAGLAVPEGLARAHLGLLYVQRGRLTKALSVTRPLAAHAGHPAAAAALASRCAALLEQDRRDAVAQTLPETTALALRADQPSVLVNVHLVWHRLHRALGDDARAHEALEAAQTAAARGVPTWLRALVTIRAAEASLLDGDDGAAEAHLRAAEALAPRGPVTSELRLCRARVQLRRGTARDLADALGIARSLSGDDAPGDGVRIAALVLAALAAAAGGSPREAQTTLARAVRAAEPEGYVRTFVEAGQPCAALLASLGHPYAARLLRAFGPAAPVGQRAADGASDATALTERERDTLVALASARAYAGIATDLGLSVNTVRFHVKNVYAKLGVRTRLEAVERARRLGYLTQASDGRGTATPNDDGSADP